MNLESVYTLNVDVSKLTRDELGDRIAHLDEQLVGDMTPEQQTAHYAELDAYLDEIIVRGYHKGA